MVSVAEIRSPHDGAPDSAHRRLLETVPGVDIELESFVPIDDGVAPYVWAWGNQLAEFERAIERLDEITDVERLDDVEDGALFRVEWEADSPLMQCVQRSNGSLMDVYGTTDQLELTILFESGDDASAFRRCCRNAGVPLQVDRLRPAVAVIGKRTAGITDAQREALLTAHDVGYFERPRAVTQSDLAERLGISAAAVGSRLRRGTANLVEHHFLD